MAGAAFPPIITRVGTLIWVSRSRGATKLNGVEFVKRANPTGEGHVADLLSEGALMQGHPGPVAVVIELKAQEDVVHRSCGGLSAHLDPKEVRLVKAQDPAPDRVRGPRQEVHH
jgi:hypothetical protein